MKFKITNQPLSVFSYSSLTDIVMLLLIFFLLTSQFVVQTGVKVKLPGSKTNQQTLPTKLVVTITSAGAVYAGTQQISIDQLPAKLSLLKKNEPDNNLIIRADKRVPVDMVIKVIDAARSSGIDKFTIQTERKKL
jgi:biopolymer transport protein ExbD